MRYSVVLYNLYYMIKSCELILAPCSEMLHLKTEQTKPKKSPNKPEANIFFSVRLRVTLIKKGFFLEIVTSFATMIKG